MTSSFGPLPFLLHFGERIPTRPAVSSRYDASRHVGQVYVGSKWVDALDAHQDWLEGASRRTDVNMETTDDD